VTGWGEVAGFVLLRARAHRLLLTAALLTVLLTTAVLATLTAYSGAIGDAALRHSLRDTRNAADAALIVKADVPAQGRTAADTAVRKAARTAFDGLPVTVRTLVRSGPYALPRSPRPGAGRAGDPDLTHFAALDRTLVGVVAGRLPRPAGPAGDVEAALPQNAARLLGLTAGDRLTLADRLGGPPVRVTVTGLYRPARADAPYWQLDDLRGRGVQKVDFTTYGPLLADPGVLSGTRLSTGRSAWLASADFAALTTGRIDALRASARTASAGLRGRPALGGSTAVTTGLPDVLDRVDRSLLVSRSTLLIVALQLVLLAGCALLLVARLLSAERAGETRLLRARGASRRGIAGLALPEALLLAVPSLICAPLLAGPLARLLAGHGPLARIGLRLDLPAGGGPGVWLVAVAAALACALAVTLPALTSSARSGAVAARRARALPGPVRAGADLGLLAVAVVAYWQLSRQTSGAVTGGRSGALGVDPLLVAAPALALLAGTVLALRLLPPVARLAERRAVGGRGLTAALAGWQIARRPMRGAGPVLLLVLAVALGLLAIGQGASWDRSQDDQADFRAGVPLRVLAAGDGGPGRTEEYAALPGVREAAPAVRSTLSLPDDRTATLLALDTAHAADTLLMRADLAPGPVRPLVAGLGRKVPVNGARVPAHTARLRLTATLRSDPASRGTADVFVTVRDGHGTPYRLPAGKLPADGRPHPLDVATSDGPLVLTGLDLVTGQPVDRPQRHRFSVDEVTATAADGSERRLSLPAAWKAASQSDGKVSSPDARTNPTRPRASTSGPPAVEYGTGYVPAEASWSIPSLTVRLQAAQPRPPEVTALASDRFLASAGARPGQRVDVTIGGETVPVRITHAVRALPTVTEESGGGALLVDLPSVNRVLEARYGESVTPTEWWLRAAPGRTERIATALRARPDMDASQVVVRDEIAQRLRDDPFGAGPEAAFAAAAGAAAALAAVGFAVSAAGSLRERGAELAVLRALGAPRRRLARAIAVEQGVLVGLALLVGVALGTALARAVIPLVVLTSEAARPVPPVLVELPLTRVAVLLAAVTLAPLLVTTALAVRRADPAMSLREQGGE
jgi:hypothetical protein